MAHHISMKHKVSSVCHCGVHHLWTRWVDSSSVDQPGTCPGCLAREALVRPELPYQEAEKPHPWVFQPYQVRCTPGLGMRKSITYV